MNIKFTHITKRRAAGTIDSRYFEALHLPEEGWRVGWWLNESLKQMIRSELNRRTVMVGAEVASGGEG